MYTLYHTKCNLSTSKVMFLSKKIHKFAFFHKKNNKITPLDEFFCSFMTAFRHIGFT